MSVINTNVKALVAQESMRSNNLKLSTAMERLSTGLRINSAKDDAAGLAITNRMSSQIRGLSMAVKNANDAISMAQTADGAYGQVTSMLQRMRELAVQASNGAMSGSDRSSIQLEIDELKAEIENVAQKTSFNGIKLLDGSAKDLTMQTGANQGDTISIGFDSVKTTHIGSGLQPGLTSVGGDNDKFGAISAGTLVINGVQVGESLESDDNLSSTGNASSSIAKAAAINRVSAESGVYARVNATEVMGLTGTMSGVATSGTVTINGVETSAITTGTDAEINRALITNAINAMSSQTGVRAVNTGSDTDGIQLIADDGRNIVYQTSAFTAAASGLKVDAAGTAVSAVGTYTLYSTTGSSINIESMTNISADVFASTGLKVGTFEANQATVVGTDRSAVTYGANATTLDSDDLVINGVAISKTLETDDTASYDAGTATGSDKAASAIAVAAAINKKSDVTGVTAKAEANIIRGTGFTASTGSAGVVQLNGVAITMQGQDLENVIDAFNEQAGQTGVTARRYGDGLELRADDGRNIAIGIDSASGGLSNNALGLSGVTLATVSAAVSATTYYASVSLSSEAAFTVTQGSDDDTEFEDLGFRAGTFGGENTGVKIAQIDVTTQEGASQAISAIDSAIDDVAAAQARSGAFQNRLDSIVSVLSESIENQSASRSRILDTDYATETTALAKAQIVQQAATAMLAQANQSAQSVLALLQ
jgi:flagellin